MSNRRRAAAALAPTAAAGLGVGLLLGAAPTVGASDTAVDLLAGFDIRIDGAAVGDYSGGSVAGAGDVNGDGLDDVIVGAPRAGNNGRNNSGSSYVVFGRAATTTVDLDTPGTWGFRVDGATADDRSGGSVAGAGDVNGDGLDDVIVGAPRAGNNGRSDSGSSYVVFGGVATSNVDLGMLGSRGFRIDGAAAYDGSGGSVAGAGDVNGDGLDDVIIGAPDANNSGGTIRGGSSFVVFGGASTATVDLGMLGPRGFRIDGAASGDSSGGSVAGAGDVNGDGKDDVVIGAASADNNGRGDSGSSYVVFGDASPGTVDLAGLGSRGFRIDGAASVDLSGGSVAGAGDVNGDGKDDVVIGAASADNNRRLNSGSSYVVFGGVASDVDLGVLASRGFRIDGAASGDSSGGSVAGAGDVNGDGLDDVIAGAFVTSNNNRGSSGSSYIVLGGVTSDVDLGMLGSRGFRIDGAAVADWSGVSVAGAGDVNGDGLDDVIVGAVLADNNGRTNSGSSYVVFGQAVMTGARPTISPPTSGPSPAARVSVKALVKSKKVKRSGRTTLVRRITVGPNQTARVRVKILPKKSRKSVKVKVTTKRVVVRTKKTPRKTRIRVRIVASGSGYTPTKWVRTWKVR